MASVVTFVQQVGRLRPTSDEYQRANDAFSVILNELKKHPSTSSMIDSATEAGSVDKRTFRTGRNELDMVVFVKDFDIDQHMKGVYLDRFIVALSTSPSMKVTYRKERDHRRSIQVVIPHLNNISVDVLATGVLHQRGLEFLKLTKSQCEWWNAATVFYGRAFMAQQPEITRDMARVGRGWRDSKSTKWERIPKSYMLDLLMVFATQQTAFEWARADSDAVRYKIIFKCFLQTIASFLDVRRSRRNKKAEPGVLRNVDIIWNPNYRIRTLHQCYIIDKKSSKYTPDDQEIKENRPRIWIADPVNPRCNVADCMHNQWRELVDYKSCFKPK